MECLFCKINNNEIPSHTIYEDDIVRVFLDIYPISKGHALVIPKDHYSSLLEAPIEVINHVMAVAKKLSPQIQASLDADGITILENSGLLQEIHHAHLHIIPTYEGQDIVKWGKDEDVDVKQVKAILDEKLNK